ncbi:MAG: hypothetical protein JW891_04970 [Candidatus Lokiarchaeota archaeon]|nr:hypothetical protein [Candidatus Lokiarchaeota archaeon]
MEKKSEKFGLRKRLRFFYGKFLKSEELQQEQNYGLENDRRHSKENEKISGFKKTEEIPD